LLEPRLLGDNTEGYRLGGRNAALNPLWLEPRMGHLTWRDTGPDVKMCRGRSHASFTVDIAIPCRDRDLVILGLHRRLTDLLGGHLRR